MSWPVPQPGLVIRYSYLWHREAQAGQEEGVKDRPCAVVLALTDEEGGTRVYALAITHSAPARGEDAVEIPVAVKTRLGLDGERSWVAVGEANVFTWPGPDLNESAQAIMGEPALRVIAHELVASLNSSVTVDWMHRDAARARMRVLVKRIMCKYGYPPDLQDAAVQTVLQQAEALSSEWARAA